MTQLNQILATERQADLLRAARADSPRHAAHDDVAAERRRRPLWRRLRPSAARAGTAKAGAAPAR